MLTIRTDYHTVKPFRRKLAMQELTRDIDAEVQQMCLLNVSQNRDVMEFEFESDGFRHFFPKSKIPRFHRRILVKLESALWLGPIRFSAILIHQKTTKNC